MRRALVLACLLCASGVLAEEPRELIYGAETMSAEERQDYRRSIAAAKDDRQRAQVREQHRKRIRERARGRGTELAEPHGVVKPKARQ